LTLIQLILKFSSIPPRYTGTNPYFGFETVLDCAGVPSEVLDPRTSWPDHREYEQTAVYLAGLFTDNFKKFEAGVASEVI
jgi:phosphoenolpyruvate carboxykinase (ATP)